MPKTSNLLVMAKAKEGQHRRWRQALLCHFYSAYKSKIHSGLKELKGKKKKKTQTNRKPQGSQPAAFPLYELKSLETVE